MADIGFVGLGRMGLPMCMCLVEAGYEVVATDERSDARTDAAACGALWRDSPAEVAAAAGVLITMLPGPAAVSTAMLGSAGALPAMAPGETWIDMTTNVPSAVRSVREQAIEQGVRVLEAPVGGDPEAARQGRLQLYIGGEADVLDDNRPMLEALADPQQIFLVGAHDAGYTTKLLVNLLWFGQAIATAEALLVAKAAAIDLRVLERVLSRSSAATAFIARDLDRLFHGDYLTTFGLDRICDELEAAIALARDYQVPSALSDLVLQTYHRALHRYGAADGELLAVALLEEEGGLRLRPDAS
ncbi:MAG TPA: NAD(P)-dependent oxidoreductase [Streptosporangiaceae bacterium]|nr:NAD(P)-dependent oxidoreductase [Streptosporangiaceae bacterium]